MKPGTSETASSIVLGCTELSIYRKELSDSSKKIVDPLEILAGKLLDYSFKNKTSNINYLQQG